MQPAEWAWRRGAGPVPAVYILSCLVVAAVDRPLLPAQVPQRCGPGSASVHTTCCLSCFSSEPGVWVVAWFSSCLTLCIFEEIAEDSDWGDEA